MTHDVTKSVTFFRFSTNFKLMNRNSLKEIGTQNKLTL